MSVPVNERSHGKLEVCVKAHSLCCYTLQITANEKIFIPRFQESLTRSISDTALSIHMLCWGANNIIVKTADDLRMRSNYQEEAIVKCNVLLSLIDIAKSIFHLTTKRVIYWSELVMETRSLIRSWRESDRKRYADLAI